MTSYYDLLKINVDANIVDIQAVINNRYNEWYQLATCPK